MSSEADNAELTETVNSAQPEKCSICASPYRAKVEAMYVLGLDDLHKAVQALGWGLSRSAIGRHRQNGHIATVLEHVTFEDVFEELFARWWSTRPKNWVPADAEMRKLIEIYHRSANSKKNNTSGLAKLFGGLAAPMR